MRRNAVQNRERILEAAEQVFGGHGPAGSTEEVARLAGVGIATVFRHFPTKAALLEATLLRHLDVLAAQAEAALAAREPGPAFRALVRTMIETGGTKVSLGSLIGDDIPDSVLAASAELRTTVARVLEQAQAAGAARASVSVDEVYLLIRSLAHSSRTGVADQRTLRRAIEVVLAGLA